MREEVGIILMWFVWAFAGFWIVALVIGPSPLAILCGAALGHLVLRPLARKFRERDPDSREKLPPMDRREGQ